MKIIYLFFLFMIVANFGSAQSAIDIFDKYKDSHPRLRDNI